MVIVSGSGSQAPPAGQKLRTSLRRSTIEQDHAAAIQRADLDDPYPPGRKNSP